MLRELLNDTWVWAMSEKMTFEVFSFIPPSSCVCSRWLFRFKKVHGWNTKRGSSISLWIVRENPMAVRRGGEGGGGRCWSLIRPWASFTQGLAAQTSILSSSTSNPLNLLRQFSKPPFKRFSLSNAPAYASMNTYGSSAVYCVKS